MFAQAIAVFSRYVPTESPTLESSSEVPTDLLSVLHAGSDQHSNRVALDAPPLRATRAGPARARAPQGPEG